MRAVSGRASKLAPDHFQGDDHRSLSAMIYGWLHGAILNGTLTPGQVLRQEELAARFKTSRVPLREALQLLQAEGLVVLRPRRGYAVNALSADEQLELLQLRILIESYAGYAGTLRRGQKHVANVSAILGEMEKLPEKPTRGLHRQRFWSLDRQFHAAIFSASGHTHLCEMFDNISARIDPYLMSESAMVPGQAEAMLDHRRIVTAFASGDADRVALLSRRHAERLAVRFAAALQKKGQVGDISPTQVTDLGPAAGMAGAAPEAGRRRKASAG